MQVLEEILEEIEREAVTNKEIGRKQCEGMARAMNIVSSHIDNAKDINISSKCSECSRRKWYQYGYEDGKKDMCNDGWIPVEDGLPEEGEEVEVTIEEMADSAGGMRYYTKTAWVQEERWVIKRNPCNPRVIAWRPLPKPYKPKKAIEDSGARS